MNPYSAPETSEPLAIDANSPFAHLDFEQVKKLYYRSCNLSCIAVLQLLGIVLICVSLLPALRTNSSALEGPESVGYVIGTLSVPLLLLVSSVGIFKRTKWGRILCIIFCILSVLTILGLNILGLLIGLAGLFACFGSPQLFGPNRYRHGYLKEEFKLRKAAMKNAKKARSR
ncbi:hypothetical protein AAFN60_15335 [Roseibacillus persicicus]|uniref:hypothetical protein n=1 Tax=Roseibacillus persicicus TaxID=454148 RepID=UPI00398BA202